MNDTDAKAIELLARHAADAQLLAAEAKAWHWNVTGPNFGDLHELFDQVASHAREATDTLAERIVQLGGHPPAFPAEWLSLGEVDVPDGGDIPAVAEMLRHLEANLGQTSSALRQDADRLAGDRDPASADTLTEWLRADRSHHDLSQRHRAPPIPEVCTMSRDRCELRPETRHAAGYLASA